MLACPVCCAEPHPVGAACVDPSDSVSETGATITDRLGLLHGCGTLKGHAYLRRWTIDRTPTGTVLGLHGDFDLAFERPDEQRLRQLVAASPRPLHLDAGELTFFDAKTLRLLFSIAAAAGGELPLLAPAPFLERIAAIFDERVIVWSPPPQFPPET